MSIRSRFSKLAHWSSPYSPFASASVITRGGGALGAGGGGLGGRAAAVRAEALRTCIDDVSRQELAS